MSSGKHGEAGEFQWQFGLSLGILLAIAAFFLATEHRAHLFGVLPYLLLLLCLAALGVLWRFAHNADGDRERLHKPPGKGDR